MPDSTVHPARGRIAPQHFTGARGGGPHRMVLGLLRRHPVDAIGVVVASGLGIAVIVNALALQSPPAATPLPKPAPAVRRATSPTAPAAPAAPAAPQATRGSPQNLVEAIQAELKRRGIYEGEIDGNLGAQTEAAIRSYQVVAGLSPTGQPSQALLKALDAVETIRPADHAAPAPAAMPAPPPAAAEGHRLDPAGLKQVQRVLAEQGFGPLEIDGVFGDATRGAIRRFEQSRGLPAKGEITPQFLHALSRMSGARLPAL